MKKRTLTRQHSFFKKNLKHWALTRVAKHLNTSKSCLLSNLKNGESMKISTAQKIISAIKESENVEISLFDFLWLEKQK